MANFFGLVSVTLVLYFVELHSYVEGQFFQWGRDQDLPLVVPPHKKDDPMFRGIPHSFECNPKPEYGRMTKIEVIPCEGNDRCDLIRGTNVTLRLEFIPYQAHSELWGSLGSYVQSSSSWLPSFTIPFGRAESLCKSRTISCPAQAGKEYVFEKQFEVLHSYPSRKLNVSIWITGEKRKTVACVLVPVEIKDKPTLIEEESEREDQSWWFQ